ncbi:VPS9 domain-containing protein 1 isoform X3 [Pan paniscus]|uniref:VPS9 domain-containing protein 1 isoform X3 n=1 Tax=Pan paniscus TaxID=9597 RepID=UPI0024363A87|nr:VPS9 domain-containing protein 1 isoform X3 [Pan paniscus]
MAAAAGDGTVKPLQSAMKLANGAIELDTGNRPREAYTEYLRSIHYISQVLLEEVETTKAGETVPPDTSKMLKLAQQCLERAQSTAAKLGKTRLKPTMPAAAPIPQPAGRHRRVYSDEGGKLSPFLPPEIFQKLQGAESQSCKKELTPLEEASLQNQKLKAAYEARMARLDPSQAMQKTSLTLSLQRQMMENLVIAKAREETLQRKMEERRLRLQEAANRRFCSQVALTPEEREQRALYAAILEYEQDHDWPKHWKAKLKRNPGDLSLVTSLVSHLLSLPDHPIAQLLRRLQCSVYSALYPAVSRAAAPAPGCCPPTPNPGSRRLRPSQSLHCMLSPPEPSAAPRPQDSPPTPPLQPGPVGSPSPLGDTASGLPDKDSSFEDLEQFLGTSERQGRGRGVQPEPQLQQLKTAVEEIHNAIDRLLSLTLLAFEGLNTAASKDRCLACIEEPFFCPLWPLLLALYRSVHRAREAALSRSMELYRNAPPTAIGIPTKLLPQNPEAKGATDYPYCAAAQELGLLVLESCPQKKLECIVRTLRIICVCAEDYCPTPEATPQAGPPPIAAAAILVPAGCTVEAGGPCGPSPGSAVRELPLGTASPCPAGFRCLCAEGHRDGGPHGQDGSTAAGFAEREAPGPNPRPLCPPDSGADDLLPILSFVVLRSGLPQLASECAALEEFIHEGYLIGEEGYCLTSLQSALSYVELLPRGGLAK